MMKKGFYLFLVMLSMSFIALAAAGDTTWVQAHSNIWLPSSPKNMDTTIEFPDGSKSYRKIFMTFTLGKYQCPGNPQWCGDWDYTVQNFLMTPNGDSVELGRLITPYANASNSRTPWNMQQRYTFDVTDYYPLLKDSATVRIHYSGYSGGFTANVKFAFIEGTPPRNVLGIERLWHGSPRFGEAANPIDTKITTFNKTAAPNTVFTEMKFNITGHGSDDYGCSEFCKKYYKVMLNGNTVEQKDIWRADCGYNHFYPQTGTWIYDRGNWCPGDQVQTNVHKLAGITGGNTYDIDVDFETYTGSVNNPNTSWGSYIIDAAVFYYGAFNRQTDASLEDIIAPNNHEVYFRSNPRAGNPIVKIKNTGANTITSLKIAYETTGAKNEYVWQGSIAALADAEISLPELWEARGLTGTHNFTAKILEVNGQGDEDNTNNSLTTSYVAPANWPMEIIIRLSTNKSQVGGVSESSWYLIEGGKDTIAKRINNTISTVYEDTVKLGPSFYYLVVEDKGCDGLNWWNNSAAGAGGLAVRSTTSSLPFQLKGYYAGDFGCGFTQSFNVTWPAGVPVLEALAEAIELYPNPAQDKLTVIVNDNNAAKGVITIIDALGRIVTQQSTTGNIHNIDTRALNNGLYTVRYAEASGSPALHSRLVIAK
jgi:hypothetical protein